MEARNGKVILPDGMSYRMVVLPRNGEMTLAALKKIASFVKAGVPVYGPRPVGSPTREDMVTETEYRKWVAVLWGDEDSPEGVHRYGKGSVYWGMSLTDAITAPALFPTWQWKKVM